MFPYWLLFLVFAAAAFVGRHSVVKKGDSRAPLFAAGLLISLMIGLRFEVGGDWFAYIKMFARLEHVSWAKAISISDPGYVALNWIVKKLGFQIWLVNLICGSIFTWGLIRFASRQPNPWLAIAVAVPYLIIVVAMGYTRQAVALGFIMAGLGAQRDTSLLRYSALILLAATFHKTAVIILPLVALSQTSNKVMKGSLLAIVSIIFVWLFLSSDVDRLLKNYVEAKYSSQGAAIRVSMNIIPAMFFMKYWRRFNLVDEDSKFWLNFSYVAILILVIFFLSPSSTVVDRLALYAIPLQLFVFSRLPLVFQERGRAIASFVILAYSALVLFVWLNYAANAETWIPYQIYPL